MHAYSETLYGGPHNLFQLSYFTMASAQTFVGDFKRGGKHLCAICTATVHSCSKKTICCICHDWVHLKCCQTSDPTFICQNCISFSLPFSSVEKDDFYKEVGLDFCLLNGRLSELNNLRYSLNPFDHLNNNNFINNFATDADDNCLNLFTGHSLGYMDTDQLDSSLQVQNGEGKLGSIMHINARSLIANVDLLCANLRLLKK